MLCRFGKGDDGLGCTVGICGPGAVTSPFGLSIIEEKMLAIEDKALAVPIEMAVVVGEQGVVE